jgi:hypothetical protein
MASTKLEFSIDSPERGHRFGLGEGIQARGTAHVVNVGFPIDFSITGVDVQFGGGQFFPADLSGPNGPSWQLFGVPVGSNTVLDVVARCHLKFAADESTTSIEDRVSVIVGNLIPRVDIDPFDADVTVADLPYNLPEVNGSVTEPFTNVTTVQWQLDGGPLHPVDSVSGGRWRVTNLSIPAAKLHHLTFVATDPFNSSGSATVDVRVRVPIEPGARDRVFAMTSYLGELLGLAQRYVSVDGAPPGPLGADLESRLHQPLDGLTRAAAFQAANADVSQTRLAVEVLRGVIAPTATRDIDKRHRQLAYEALLTGLGTSAIELRLARTAEQAQRVALATRLGLLLETSRPDQLDRITFATDTITDAQLAQLFGYQATVPAPLEGPAAGSAQVLLAKIAAARLAWRDADALERDDQTSPRPIILPDLLTGVDFVDGGPASPARQLFAERTTWRAAQRKLISDSVAGTNRALAGFDAAVTTFIGVIDVAALADRDRAGENIGPALFDVGLDKRTFRRLARLRSLLASGELADEEWDETIDLLLMVSSRHQYGQWRQEEIKRGIVLDPAVFAVRPDAPQVTPDFQATLTARAAELARISNGLTSAVTDAEAQVLPRLRDALITEIGTQQPSPQPFELTAERLSRALAFDLRLQRDRRTTRVGQAVETMQDLFTAARSGSYRPDLGVPVLQIANENNFDLEYEWLITYERWLSAMRAFAYPENQLQPQLFVKENLGGELVLAPTNPAYTDFLTALSKLADPTPDNVRQLANSAYLGQLPAEQRPGFELTERLDNTKLADRQKQCIDLVQHAQGGGTPITTEAHIPQHIRELFWLVPVAVARKLQAAGHFVAALDWFRTAFAFHLPAERRPIYYGLVLEQSLKSDFGRLPEWLSQVRELNPHFTARNRKGAYTRASALSVAECFLDFADSVFAQNTVDSRARALVLYQSARDLLALPEVAPEQGDTVPFPPNPVWQSLVNLADVGLVKVHAGLDIAGQAAPAVTDFGNFLPSPYRFSVLIDRAKTLVGIAQQVETAYLSALERLDGENYALLQAGRDLQIAAGSLIAQDLRVEVAANGIEQAGLQRDRAQLQFNTYDSWIEGGLNDAEQTSLDALRVAEGLHGLAALTQLAGSLNPFGLFDKTSGTLAAAFAEAASAASTESQIQQMHASFERRRQEWELSRGLADKDLQIAQVQITSARLQHQVAQQEQQVAVDQLVHARAVAEFLATKFTNAELYDWMSGVLGKAYAFFLQQATALALLAQAQLAFERQELVSGFIVGDYWQVNSGQLGQTGPDRRGITGSVRLLQDIIRLDEHAFDTDRRKLHLTQIIAVSQFAAFELEQFRQTGVLTFATPQALFDSDFPGHYLRLVRQVSVSLIALVPPGRGLRATLSASGVSRAVVARGDFQTVTLQREPETIALTAPINANGLFQLEPESNLLRPFEGMGVDTVWQLHLPKPANPFDFRSIAEVLLTIEYTALDSAEYREQIIRSLNRAFSADRSFSVRDQFPDAWYQLNNPDTIDGPARRMRVSLPVTKDDMPPHIPDLKIAHLTAFVVRDDALTDEVTIPTLAHTISGLTTQAAEVHTVSGVVSTRRPGGLPWEVFQESDPTGVWDMQLPDTEQVRTWFTDGLIRDIVLMFTLAGTTPAWS